jgi:hypothetical protein
MDAWKITPHGVEKIKSTMKKFNAQAHEQAQVSSLDSVLTRYRSEPWVWRWRTTLYTHTHAHAHIHKSKFVYVHVFLSTHTFTHTMQLKSTMEKPQNFLELVISTKAVGAAATKNSQTTSINDNEAKVVKYTQYVHCKINLCVIYHMTCTRNV